MKGIFFVVVFLFLNTSLFGQNGYEILFPDSLGWTNLDEGRELSFRLETTHSDDAKFSIEGVGESGIEFDSLGNFYWKPSFDLADRISRTREITVIFDATWPDGKKVRTPVTFTVNHVNRAPVVEDLPVFYVKLGTENKYQIPADYVYDPDGDPLVFKSIVSQMPEGANLNSQGQLTWTLSRGQFFSLKSQPIFVEFFVEDQPEKMETKGRLKIAPTQQDLPPEILIVPGDSMFTLQEDETINLKIYVSDPNGDDNVVTAGFVSLDKRIPFSALKSNTSLQYEFTWSPGYDFVDEINSTVSSEIVFFVLDKSNNRTERKIVVHVNDAENIEKKDAHLFQKYRSNLVEAVLLIKQLDDHQKKLNSEYKKARKGKKHRSILNASLGAVTGLSPVVIEADQSKIVSGVGGTTVLTLGTLEATEVIGRSKETIMEKIKNTIDIRNRAQAAGDEFARKYALKTARRSVDFDKDIEKLRTVLNDQRIVLLELDAYSKNAPRVDDKDIRKIFVDYAEIQI